MKKVTGILLIMLISYSLFAKRVDIESAKSIGKNYYSLQAKEIKGWNIEDPIVSETIKLNRGKGGADLIYVFNFENGFVMVSAEDRFTPILGFSLEGKYVNENQPPAFIQLIESYKEQIENVDKNPSATAREISEQWRQYSANYAARITESNCKIWPKFFTKDALLTTTWAQTCYYNEQCPYDTRSSHCSRAPSGCVAVAMAQVMKYWNYPATGAGSRSYTDTEPSGNCPGAYGLQSANFGATTYNWASMPNSLTSSSSAISTLMYHCGVSVDMDYGYSCSVINGTAMENNVKNAFINYFKYSSSAQFIIKQPVDPAWEGKLTSELDNNRPVIYCGIGGADGGHTFVLDGYSKMQTECCSYAANFHVNWGWGGNQNGYYLLNNMQGYNYAQAALIGIKPSSYTYPVPPQISYISEPACSPHCRYSEVDYFVPPVVNATNYEWNITGITGVAVIPNGRYGTISTHRYGTGTLWCRAVNSNGIAGPWQTRSLVISNCVGRLDNEDEVNDIQIYPNPASNTIYINLPNYDNYAKAELMDMQGKTLKTILIDKENTAINTEDINNGLYLIKLISNQGTEVKKVSVFK